MGKMARMRQVRLIALAGLCSASGTALAHGDWLDDGARSCTFDGMIAPMPCRQYHQAIAHEEADGTRWTEWRWMWKAGDGHEVHYAAHVGMVGVSSFTIGEISDKNHAFDPDTQAVSYARGREELVIGVPGDGYEFSVRGGV
jgi:hypothetical protein